MNDRALPSDVIFKLKELTLWRKKLLIIGLITSVISGFLVQFYFNQKGVVRSISVAQAIGGSIVVLELFWNYFKGVFKEKKVHDLLNAMYDHGNYEFHPNQAFVQSLIDQMELKETVESKSFTDHIKFEIPQFKIHFIQVTKRFYQWKKFKGLIIVLEVGKEMNSANLLEKLSHIIKDDHQIKSSASFHALLIKDSPSLLSPKLFGEIVATKNITFINDVVEIVSSTSLND